MDKVRGRKDPMGCINAKIPFLAQENHELQAAEGIYSESTNIIQTAGEHSESSGETPPGTLCSALGLPT